MSFLDESNGHYGEAQENPSTLEAGGTHAQDKTGELSSLVAPPVRINHSEEEVPKVK